MQGWISAANPWCDYSLCRHKSGSLTTGALSIAGERISVSIASLTSSSTGWKSHLCLLVQLLYFCPQVSEKLLCAPSVCTGEISHGFKNQWYHSERKNPARVARFRAVAGKETAGGGRTISHLHCSYSFGWLYTTIFTVLSCRRSSPNLGCEHSDTGTGSCTAPAQPSFAPGYQHNLLTGTNYQCRNAGINKVHKLHIKSSWRIINPRASYSYQKARVYTVKAFLKCHMRLQQ